MKPSFVEHAPKLRMLVVLVKTGGFAATARRLEVSTSAVSQAISALETLVGSPLIVRAKGDVRPTVLGARLLQSVGPALAELEAAPGLISLSSVAHQRRLDLGAYESIAMHVLPTLLPRLRASHPQLRVQVRTGRSGELCTLLRKGELDLALVAECNDMGSLSRTKLTDDRLGLFAAAKHPASRGALGSSTLAGLAPGASGHPLYYRRFLRSLGRIGEPAIESDSFETLRYLAAKGTVVAILPERVAKRDGAALREMTITRDGTDAVGKHGLYLVAKTGRGSELHQLIAQELVFILGQKQ